MSGILNMAATYVGRRWRFLVLLCLVAGGLQFAIDLADRQGRADLPLGYAVRMTCEEDPESYLWSGGCERLKADIARTDKPSFLELYQAFVAAHHWHIPTPGTQRRFAGVACASGYDIAAALKGTRFVLEPERFTGVCTPEHARAIQDELDERARALLTIERAGLTWPALMAGTLANLTEPLVLFGIAAVLLALWLL